jgi:hypothetical protein
MGSIPRRAMRGMMRLLAQAEGIAESTLRRARERLAVRLRHAGFLHGGARVWEVAADADATTPTEMFTPSGDAHMRGMSISDISSISALNSGTATCSIPTSTGAVSEV